MNALQSAITDELARLSEAGNGLLLPQSIVDAARDPHSVLHEEFEWDDSVAGEQWRVMQARILIRSVRSTVTYQTISVRVPAYLHDPKADGQGYAPIGSLRSHAETAEQAMATEINRISSAATRAREIALGLGLVDQIEQQIREAISG